MGGLELRRRCAAWDLRPLLGRGFTATLFVTSFLVGTHCRLGYGIGHFFSTRCPNAASGRLPTGAARARRCPSILGPVLHCARVFWSMSSHGLRAFRFLPRVPRPLMVCSNSAFGSGLTGRLPCRMLRCVKSAALLFHPSPFCARGCLRHALAVLRHGRAERGVVSSRCWCERGGSRWMGLHALKRWESRGFVSLRRDRTRLPVTHNTRQVC